MLSVRMIRRRNRVLDRTAAVEICTRFGPDELLHQPDQLGQQELAAPLPGGLHLVVKSRRRLEDDLLHPEFPAELCQVDFRHPVHVRLALDDRGQLDQRCRIWLASISSGGTCSMSSVRTGV